MPTSSKLTWPWSEYPPSYTPNAVVELLPHNTILRQYFLSRPRRAQCIAEPARQLLHIEECQSNYSSGYACGVVNVGRREIVIVYLCIVICNKDVSSSICSLTSASSIPCDSVSHSQFKINRPVWPHKNGFGERSSYFHRVMLPFELF